MTEQDTPLASAQRSLERMQTFTASKLERVELGQSFNFSDAVPHAERIIHLFQRIPVDSLSEFPAQQLKDIQGQADTAFNLFEQVGDFDETVQNASQARNQLISRVEQHYQGVFNKIMPYISYGVARTVDFQRIENDGRATLQSIRDQTDTAIQDLEISKTEAAATLDEIKRTAAEHGVSQQAHYFSEEASEHSDRAADWQKTTRNWAVGLIVYGVLSFFLHKIPILTPSDPAEAIIFVSSKILIFAVLTYMLVLSARNFLSHKHNAVVNKHRQNALMTFNALVKAGQGEDTQNIVLGHASSCIFSPQDTGYTRHGNANSMANVTDLVPKTTVRLDG